MLLSSWKLSHDAHQQFQMVCSPLMPIHRNKLKGNGSMNQIPLLAKSSNKGANVSTNKLRAKPRCPVVLQGPESANLGVARFK